MRRVTAELEPAPAASDAARALAGALAGAAASCVCSPLDVAKTRIQLRGQFADGARFNSLTQSLRLIFEEEGARGLYRGLSATLTTVPLFYCAFFPVYERAKTRFAEWGWGDLKSNVAAAITAGALADSLTNPLWVIRTRMQTENMHFGAAAENVGVVQMGRQILRNEGAFAFYKGFGASLLGLTHVAVQLPIYEELKVRLDCGTPWLNVPLAAALSKLIATCATYPHETLRTRLQDQRATGDGRRYRGLVDCARVTIREEGLRGLYAGLQVNIVRVVPAAVTTFAIYESVVSAFAGE